MEDIKYTITDYLELNNKAYQEFIIREQDDEIKVFFILKGKEIDVSNFFSISNNNLDEIINGLKEEGFSDEDNENTFGAIADRLKKSGPNLGYGFKDNEGNFFGVDTVSRDFYNLNIVFIINNKKYELEEGGAITADILEELKDIQINLKNDMKGLNT